MSSSDYEGVSTGSRGVRAGVNGLGFPTEVLDPALHLKKTPLRNGAMDAFQHPSLTAEDIRIPYWGSKE